MARKIPGTSKIPDVTLKRGVVASADEFAFNDAVVVGQVPTVMPDDGSQNDVDVGMTGSLRPPAEPDGVPADPSGDGFDLG